MASMKQFILCSNLSYAVIYLVIWRKVKLLQRSHFHFAVSEKMLKKQFLGAKIHFFKNVT